MKSFIPTPTHSALAIGPFTLHYSALCILAGVIVALIIGRSRYTQMGADPDEITDIAIFAIPAGIVGGRLYHVLTSPQRYFGKDGHPLDAIKIWDGGMGIWGAIALGTLVAYLVFRSHARSASFATFADALAPGLLLAQGIGRIGNCLGRSGTEYLRIDAAEHIFGLRLNQWVSLLGLISAVFTLSRRKEIRGEVD